MYGGRKFPKQKPIEKGNSMENKLNVKSKSHIISIGENHPNIPQLGLLSKNKTKNLIVIVTILLALFSFPFSLLLSYGQLVEPEVDSLNSDLYSATWTFENASCFNTTETIITNGMVILQSYNYTWNQASKKDFERGIKDNVTLIQKPIIVDIGSWNFESGEEGWEHGRWGGTKDEWELGFVSEIPEFIGSHGSSTKLWGTKLSGKYDDSDGSSDYYLKSPSIDLGGYENIELSFWHYYIFDNETNTNDGGILEVSTDDGLTWEQIWPKAGYGSQIEDENNPISPKDCFGGNSSKWVQAQFDLSPYRGSQNFFFRFRFATNGQISDYGWYIDDVIITSTTFSDGVELSYRDMQIGSIDNIVPGPVNVTIIDVDNPANVDGILTEWIVYIYNINSTPAKGRMKIFREEDGQFKFIGETNPEEINQGYNEFDCDIEVKAGDYIGWYSDNTEIFAQSGGSAFYLYDNISGNFSTSYWKPISYNLSIRAVGISKYPVGTLKSQVFDAGSPAIWGKISWSEDISPSGKVDVVLQTRTGNSKNPEDGSWEPWSPQIVDSSGEIIRSSNARYIQFQAILTTIQQPYTPTLLNVSISYKKYSPYGEVETDDFVPDVVVQWQEFYRSENLNNQYIGYQYSLDLGETWHSIPDSGNLSYVSVLEGRIRFKAKLSTENTSVSSILYDMNLNYSSAEPSMGLSIEADKKEVKPGDTLSFTIYYDNNGTGIANNVFIILKLDENLSFKRDYSGVIPTKEEGNAIKWRFFTVDPSNRFFIVETKVKDDINEETTISTYAIMNYTDIGGNRYEGAVSNEISIKVTTGQDLNPYYILLSAIIVIIIISFMVLAIRRLKTKQKLDERIALEDVEKGIGYLVMEENPVKSYTLFSDLIDKGNEGLCITRTFPGRVLTSYYFEGVSLMWLSRSRDVNSILPTNLGAVLRNAKEFMEQNKNPVILLDGLEYLIVHNDFPRVLKLVHGLNELTAINDAVLIMPLNPLTLDEDKVALLKRDLKVIA